MASITSSVCKTTSQPPLYARTGSDWERNEKRVTVHLYSCLKETLQIKQHDTDGDTFL